MSSQIEKKATRVRSMFGAIAARYDVTNSVLSFGIHHYWKHLVAGLLEPGAKRVLDLCTGTGDLLPRLSVRYGKLFGGQIVGGDFCYPMLAQAKRRFGERFALVQADALNLPFSQNRYDLVTVAFGVRNFENLESGLTEIHRVLSPGGHIAILEFGQPEGMLFGPLYRWYSRALMPLIGGVLTGNIEAYRYLPHTAAEFLCGAEFERVLERCKFTPVKTKRLTLGIAYIYLASKN